MNEFTQGYDFGNTDPTLGKGKQESALERAESLTGLDINGFFARLEEATNQLKEVRLQIAEKKAQKARLDAKYLTSGTLPSHWDHQRKLLLAELAESERQRVLSLKPDAKEPSAASLDTFAHAHARYRQFIDAATAEREEHAGYRAEIDKLYAEAEHLQGVREYLIQRLRLNEELIRHNRSLANLGG